MICVSYYIYIVIFVIHQPSVPVDVFMGIVPVLTIVHVPVVGEDLNASQVDYILYFPFSVKITEFDTLA